MHASTTISLYQLAKSAFAVLFATLLLSSTASLSGQVLWNGSVDGNWNTAGNWVGAAVPGTTSYVQFNEGSINDPTTLGSNQNVAGLIFNHTSHFTLGADEAFELTLTYNTSPSIDLIGSGSVELLSNLNLTGGSPHVWRNQSGQNFSASGNLKLQTNLALEGSANSTYTIGTEGTQLISTLANRTITVKDTGAVNELTINSDIVLSEHATTARTFALLLESNASAIINGNLINGSSNNSNFRLLGSGDATFNGSLLHTGYFAIEEGASATINGSVDTGEFRVLSGSAKFEGSSATIRGLVLGNATGIPNVNLEFVAGFTLNLAGDVTVRNTSTPVTLDVATLNLGASRIFNITQGNTLTIDSTITGSSARIHKADNGTLILKGSSTYNGSNNAVTAGTLILDFSENTDSKLSHQDLTVYDSTLTLRGNADTDVVQTIKNLRISNSANFNTAHNLVNIEPVSGRNVTLAIETLIRDNNSYGTIHFHLPTNSAVTTTMADTPLHSSWATINQGNGDHFVAVTSGQLTSATSSISNDDLTRAWAPTLVNSNVTDETGYSGTTDQMSIGSLRVTAGSPIQVVQHLHIESGGILVTDTSTSSGIHGGILTVGDSHDELVVHQNSSTSFEISSDLRNYQDQTSEGIIVTKTGAGELILSGQNRTAAPNARFNHSGNINILQGTLTVAGGNAIGDNTTINLSSSSTNGLKLLADETTASISGLTNKSTIDIGTHTLTIKQLTYTQYSGAITGSGTIIKDILNPLAPEAWQLNGTNNDSFTGNLIINSGLVSLAGNGIRNLNQINSITINQGGGLLLDNNGATGGSGPNYLETSRINDSATITLRGANGRSASTGIINGFKNRSNNNSVHGELIANLDVNSGSNYVVLEATAASNANGNNAVLIRATNSITRQNHSSLTIIGSNLAGASGSRTRLQMAETTANAASVAFANQFRTGGIYANGSTALATVGASDNPTSTSLSIVPWAIGQNLSGAANATTMGNSFVIFEADVSGFRALRLDTEYASYATTASVPSGNNVRESSGSNIDLTATGGTTVNSLLINNQNASNTPITVTGSGTLSNTSGAFLFTGTGAVDSNGRATANATQGGIVVTGFSNIEVTGPNKEYHMFVTNTSDSGVTIHADFTTANSALTKSGIGLLKLTGNNTAVDEVTINEGTLEISNRNNLGGTTGILNLAGGTLKLASDWLASEQDLTGYTIAALDGTISRIHTNGNTGAAGTDDVDARLTFGPLAAGSGTIIKEGNGRLTLTGSTGTLHTGDFYVYHTGNVDGAANGNVPQLVLNNSGGNAIGGNLYLGSPDAANAAGGAVVFHEASEQIADTATVTFYGNASGGGNRGYWHLRGHNETIAGIIDTAGNGVIQNNANGTTSTLTVVGSGDYLFSGYLRNQSGTLAFTKDGTGTQTLRGNQINYTGITNIINGRLILSQATSFNSNINNESELEMEQNSGTWAMSKVISGDGHLLKSGNGILRLDAANTYTGQTSIQAGTLALGVNGSIANSSSINIKAGATFDVSDKGPTGYTYHHHLSGNGTVRGNLAIGNNGSIRPGASSAPFATTSIGDQLGSLSITGNLTLDGGIAQLQMASATFNDLEVLTKYAAGQSEFSSYLSDQALFWNSQLYHDNHGVPHHDYIQIGGDFIWENGSVVSYTGLNYTPTAGDILNLWDWANITGSFDLGVDENFQRIGGLLGDLELPDVAGLIYDLSLFESHGIIVVVPEPSRVLLLLLATVPLMFRRRR